jgi:protein-tyrosine phosphatase
MSHIFENIYLGSLEDAQDEKFIKANNIKIIIWLSDEQEKSFHSNNINFFNFKVEDVIFESNKLFNLCRVIYKILDNNTDNIFIHCTQGVSRSPTVVLYYLMRKYNLKFQEAFKIY